MRGDRKKKLAWFKQGHSPWNKGLKFDNSCHVDTEPKRSITRLTVDEFPVTSRPTADGSELSGNAMLLRPSASATSSTMKKIDDKNSCSGMRIVDSEEMSGAFNNAYRIHRQEANECEQPNFHVAEERKVGLCWKVSLKCDNCSFITPFYKLYKEVSSSKRGPNAATANVSLAVGLQDTPIGNTKCRYLLTSIDIPPPARSSMQRTSNTVGSAIKQLNDDDMSEKINKVKEINRKRGNPENAINIALDGRYNSSTIASRKKAGQNASQSIAIACETITEKQYIIAAAVQNKLCWTGAWLRGKGYDVTCPGGHAGCTANTYRHAPLSEYELGKSIGETLNAESAFVRYVTTDGDSRSAAGVSEAMRLLDPMWKVERQADPTHLGQAQFRCCYKAHFSNGMFPSAKTRDQRHEQQKALSQDIKARCNFILKELMRIHTGDMNTIKKYLPRVLDATVSCYAGDCSKCRRYSYVCSGGVTNNWWNRSMFLSSHRITNLCLQENDKQLIFDIVKMKISVSAIEQMKLGTSTQKCEAVNRSISVSLPKNNDFARNIHGRLSSTIHRLNNGVADSAEKKLGCLGIRLSEKAANSLHQMQREETYQRQYSKKPETVKRKLLSKGRQLHEHLKYKKTHSTKSDYRKGQLDPTPTTSKGGNSDHTYSENL